MKLTTTLSTIVLALGLATTACSKKKDAPAGDKPAAEAPKPTETKPADPAAAPAPEAPKADPAAAPTAGAVTFTSDEQYLTEAKAAIGRVMETFKAAGTDCDKLAKGLSDMASDPKIAAATAYEKDHPEAKKKFEEAAKADQEAFMKLAEPGLKACMGNPAVGEALKKLSE